MHTRSSIVAAAVLAAAVTGTARAQGTVDAQCAAPPYAITVPPVAPTDAQVRADACQKALDLFNFMAPQLGVSITGGNAVLGSAGTLGGLGHVSVGLRANVIRGQLPQTSSVSVSVTGTQRSDFAPKDQVLGLPTAEAAIGIFSGVNLGVTNVGGVDALVSAFYVPDISQDAVSVSTSGGKLKLGYGARVGILQETSLVPGISVSVLRRDLPTANISAHLSGSDSVRVSELKANTTAWRLAASKGFTIVGLTAGIGQDRYDSKATAQAYIAPRAFGAFSRGYNGDVARASQKLTRTNLFAGASLNLALLRIAAEVGQVSGGSVVAPYNTFGSHKADDAYTYGSVGVRLGF